MKFGLVVEAMAVSIGILAFEGFEEIYCLKIRQPSWVLGIGSSAPLKCKAWSARGLI